ncbi:hypothetical protein A2303_01310 [Candidatus Falkowbacteria bacterium RIFOXYB2_FULL_47_14]|uniref:Pyruvate kinase barrel domain-containing protein n=1 Tax=Candidatus Falkowbacteria bacterium RIFOXYA2_FULL_47_19 TaxID=1797994 RepID=A0A1F5SH07_9BACT|nr:MAG: hypothetical protein A2227_05605 [Candidatus Falkowbacteria bacterium RIFOXYA2_FULL_47_19]OGF34490.1 MAG: hypothetical protein A2468_04650 [Candidatus Falkowbacteria bacterium RIFOXYC2_FULL_46_15]OGF43529.1 MAG: hypothetical protein A2303_01310 [Candidatus Falkowbacteria bacterium RIFOXYB2_FULL_47_14]
MLFATLPPIQEDEALEKIISCPDIDAVRYNTGYRTLKSAQEVISGLKSLCGHYNKELWIDLEGRQLRVTNQSYPRYGGQVVLNRAVNIELPAYAHFRGFGWYEIAEADGDTIFIKGLERGTLGDGQTVNIRARSISLNGYLTPGDVDFITAGFEMGVMNFMLSFAESCEDIAEAEEALALNGFDARKHKARIRLKIESPRGLEYVSRTDRSFFSEYDLIAATDDLFTNIGADKFSLTDALRSIIRADRNAILASNIFSGLEGRNGTVTAGDIAYMELMRRYGYKHFMLSDGICHFHFEDAMRQWRYFKGRIKK